MTNLKEQEAVEYLKGARQCISGERFSNLKLLEVMLEAEEAFLLRFIALGQEDMAKISVNSSGFQDIDSWQNDISEALKQYEKIKAGRFNQMQSLVGMYINVSPTGIKAESSRLSQEFEKDDILAGVFSVLDKPHTDFLSGRKGNLPFYTDRKYPGVLIALNESTPFTEDSDLNKVKVPPLVGLKYLSDRKNILYVIYEKERVKKVRVMLQGGPSLIDRSYSDQEKHYFKNRLGFRVNEYEWRYVFDISKPRKDNSEDPFGYLNKDLLEGVIGIDFPSIDPSFREILFKNLQRLNNFFESTTGILGSNIKAKKQDKRFAELHFTQAEELEKIFALLGSDDLRKPIQVALAQSLSRFRDPNTISTQPHKEEASLEQVIFKKIKIR